MTTKTHLAKLACVAMTVAALASPLVSAGSLLAPNIVDRNDDVTQNGQCPPSANGSCGAGFDFLWNDVDINTAWVTDNATAILTTLEMKANPSFTPGMCLLGFAGCPPGSDKAPATYDYGFTFAINGVTYTATAHMDTAGAFTAGGIATSVLVHDGNQLTFTIPKSAAGNAAKGDIITNLACTAHGDSQGQFKLDDKAPDANAALPYTIANGSARSNPTVYTTVATQGVNVQLAFANATTGAYVYNWTAGPANATLAFVPQGTGASQLTVTDAKGAVQFSAANATTQQVKAISGAAPGTWQVSLQLTAFKGNLTIAIAPRSTSAGTSTATGSGTATGTHAGTAMTHATSSSSSSKASPGMDALALSVALGACVLSARRRLA